MTEPTPVLPQGLPSEVKAPPARASVSALSDKPAQNIALGTATVSGVLMILNVFIPHIDDKWKYLIAVVIVVIAGIVQGKLTERSVFAPSTVHEIETKSKVAYQSLLAYATSRGAGGFKSTPSQGTAIDDARVDGQNPPTVTDPPVPTSEPSWPTESTDEETVTTATDSSSEETSAPALAPVETQTSATEVTTAVVQPTSSAAPTPVSATAIDMSLYTDPGSNPTS